MNLGPTHSTSIGELEGFTIVKVRAPESLLSQKENERLKRTVWLALILHILVGVIYWLSAPYFADREAKRLSQLEQARAPHALSTRVFTAQQLEHLMNANRSVVETAQSNKPVKNDRAAHYLGEHTQRVEKETRSAKFGNQQATGTKNSAENLQKNALKESQKAAEQSNQAHQAKPGLNLARLGLGTLGAGALHFEERNPPKKILDAKKELSVARGTHDLLGRDVAVGTETLLNTDEYKYASFFNRLKAEVAPRWEPLVGATIADPTKRVGAGYYQTQAKLAINDEGSVVDVTIEKSSGVDAFDAAAQIALRQLVRMLNPPRELREADGLYHMSLGFIVNLEHSGIRAEYVPDPRLLRKPGETPSQM